MSRTKSWLRAGLALGSTAALIALGIAAPGGVASAASHGARHTSRATVGVHYSVDKPLCAAPKRGTFSCFAVKHVEATRTTPGAHRYTVNAAYPTGPGKFGLTPGDLATAYGYDPATVTTQTVAIVDAYDDPNILADLDAFDTEYSLPLETTGVGGSFNKVGQTGSALSLPSADKSGWSGEESLDVEAVRSVCNECKILLVETDSSGISDLVTGVQAAHALGANEISNSYGGPDSFFTKKQAAQYAPLYKFPDTVVTASTGDDGWFTWDKAPLAVPSAESSNAPSSLKTVIAVGGTRLHLNADATRASETVWNNNGIADKTATKQQAVQGAGGGGCSSAYNAPAWQLSEPGYAKTGCGKERLAADISADADPNSGLDVYDSYDCGKACGNVVPGWQEIGGTSLSSPLIAAMFGLVGGSNGVAYPAETLYQESQDSTSSFYDVTVGGNSWCDGADATTCEHATKKQSGGTEANPNNLAITLKHNGKKHVVRLGDLDCGFPSATKSGKDPKHLKPIKDNRQCYAAKGYDGPTGVGTPNGLAGFTPPI